ncbi:MAG TPA: hypothetical protein DC024_04240 [Clostridiales bacterium]|nr:hypothetical protein [Clostridiales bacterium]
MLCLLICKGSEQNRTTITEPSLMDVNQLASNLFCSVSDDKPAEKITVIDKEICYVNDAYNTGYRAIPSDPDFYYFTKFPPIPRNLPVPFEWRTENFYLENPARTGSLAFADIGGSITDNVYLEPDKPWIVQLGISTPGKGDTKAGSPQYKIWYRTSNDNGSTFTPLKQVIIEGYTSMNPIEGVEIGRNGFNVDATRPIVRASNGEIMVPIGLHPWDDVNQKIYLPESSAFIFQDAGVLIGKWLSDGSDMAWKFGEWLRIDHNKSTRGLSEPTIVELDESGRFAMISRGSNLARLELPCHAWVSFSDDYCRSWSDPEPLAYSTGERFYVTTAHSTLFKSRVNGKTYWLGNLQHENPRASIPRYPLVIGEVDLDNFGVIKETVVEIDTRQPNDGGENLQLSNFSILENDKKAEIIVVLTRREGSNSASRPTWYRIKLN